MVSKFKLSELNSNIAQKYDIFLCCSSFEERCLGISRNVDINKLGKAFIFFMDDFIDYVGTNKVKLESIFGNSAITVGLKHADPIFTADAIRSALTGFSAENIVNSILLDITTFTHEALLILMRLLYIVFPEAKIDCAYTNATEYDSANEKDDKWLSKGIGDIRSVLGYPGNIFPDRKTHLIIIVGYEYERAISMINAIEPSSLALGFGRSDNATTDKDRDANEHYLTLVERMASSFKNITRFEVKCDNPFDTCEELVKQVEKEKRKNILIVPLNNKISTIGAVFTAIKNDNIQLCYAPAIVYNFANYSKIGDSCYIIDTSVALKVDKE